MIKRLGALMLAISVVVGAVLMNTKIDSVLAVSSGNGGYYEVYNKKGVTFPTIKRRCATTRWLLWATCISTTE